MNKKYIYINGKVIVIEENGNKKLIEATDNIEEVLIQENFVETIEDEINKIEVESNKYNKNKNREKAKIIAPIILSILLPIITIPTTFAIIGLGNNVLATFVNSVSGEMIALITAAITGMSIIPGMLLTGYLKSNYKIEEKEEKGRQKILESLKKGLKVAKEDLLKLKNNKTNNKKIQNSSIKKIDNKIYQKELEEHIDFCYDLGYNEEKYTKHYQKHGDLPKAAQKRHNEGYQNLMKEYLEKNTTVQVKKRVRKK